MIKGQFHNSLLLFEKHYSSIYNLNLLWFSINFYSLCLYVNKKRCPRTNRSTIFLSIGWRHNCMLGCICIEANQAEEATQAARPSGLRVSTLALAVQLAVYFPSVVYSRTVYNLTGFEWKLRTSAADWEEKLSRDSTRARLLCSRVCTLALTQESRALLEIWVVIHKSRLIYGHLAERARTHTHCCGSNSFLAQHIYITHKFLWREPCFIIVQLFTLLLILCLCVRQEQASSLPLQN